MSYNILTIPPFDKQLKRLAKKYPSIKSDIIQLIAELQDKPNSGTHLGNNCYKVRMAITSKGKGKSAGARIITHLFSKANAFICFLFMIKATKVPLMIMKLIVC